MKDNRLIEDYKRDETTGKAIALVVFVVLMCVVFPATLFFTNPQQIMQFLGL